MWPYRFPLVSVVIVVAAALACSGDDLTQPTTGTLEIVTVTTGEPLDPDGYAVSVDGTPSQAIGVNATLTLSSDAGPHQVNLSGLAPNCRTLEENPRQVAVAAGATVPLTFSVTCSPVAQSKIAFITHGYDGYDHVFTSNLDGSGETNLTGDLPGWQTSPTWSPDGSKIAFIGDNTDILLMNADGSGRTALVSQTGRRVYRLSWSPDGQNIAFTSSQDGRAEIFTMRSDGSGRGNLTTGVNPVWSPDGTRIAFERDNRIVYMDADGSNQLTIASPGLHENDRGPQWSPDGASIAFIRSGEENDVGPSYGNLWIMNSDGSHPRQLTTFSDVAPHFAVVDYDWSPDGSRLAFGVNYGSYRGGDILVIRPDGTGQTSLLDTFDRLEHPRWSPDGSRIVFTSSRHDVNAGYGQPDILVMDEDGGNVTNLTNDAASNNSPVWQP